MNALAGYGATLHRTFVDVVYREGAVALETQVLDGNAASAGRNCRTFTGGKSGTGSSRW